MTIERTGSAIEQSVGSEIPTTLVNLRDAADASALLRPGVLFRSDAPLSTDSAPHLTPWPPATVLDLRDHPEKREPHPYRDISRIVDLPLLGGSSQDPAPLRDGMGPFYARLLSGAPGALLAEALSEIARSDGAVLVHCTAGKDRTGITIAAALRLVGVDRDAIVADYARTTGAMPQVLARMAATVRWATLGVTAALAGDPAVADDPGAANDPGGELPAAADFEGDILVAPPHAMEMFLDALDASPGGARGWLLDHGLSDETLEALKRRLLA